MAWARQALDAGRGLRSHFSITMNLEHIALNHPDPVNAAKWYANNLDMQIIRTSDSSPFIHFLADKAGQGLIELYNNPKASVPDYPSQSPLILHIAFSVEDLAGTIARLQEAGATVESEGTKNSRGDELAMVRDPWGVCLQLVKRNNPLI